MKRKTTKSKSLKQQWAFERLYSHVGSLGGILTRLRQIASAHSTLNEESKCLYNAIFEIQRIDLRENKERSWEQFSSIRG